MPLILKEIYTKNLKCISLEAGDGELLSIIGPDGEGKEEIFKVIAGEVPVVKGEIILNGAALGNKKMSAVFEDYIIYKRRIKRGMYFFSYRRWLKRVDEKKLAIVSKIMNMDRGVLLSSACGHISKGEQKRFDLARYLITKRDIILLDDPLIGLDWQGRKSTLISLKEIVARFNQPCLYKANSREECEELKGRAAVVRGWRIEYCGEWRGDLNF